MERTVFKNAPLVEMIVEIRWALMSLQSLPQGGVDPFYDALKKGLAKKLAQQGYPLLEEIVPLEVPREFLGGQITTRYRKETDTWPLYQLGPGVFTVNIADGYTGWSEFRKVIQLGIITLLSSHPAVGTLEIQSLKLMAIDAFTSRHKFNSYYDFSKKYLGLNLVLPDKYIAGYAQVNEVSVASETLIPLSRHDIQGQARIEVREGRHNEERALLLNTSIESQRSLKGDEAEQEIINWFDSAHVVHSKMFKSILSPELRAILEPEEQK